MLSSVSLRLENPGFGQPSQGFSAVRSYGTDQLMLSGEEHAHHWGTVSFLLKLSSRHSVSQRFEEGLAVFVLERTRGPQMGNNLPEAETSF